MKPFHMKVANQRQKREVLGHIPLSEGIFEILQSSEKYEKSHQEQDDEERTEEKLALEASQYKDRACEAAVGGRFEDALRILLQASYMDPSNHLIQDLLAQTYLQLERWLDAVKCAERTIAIAPTWMEGYLTLARCRRELGEVTLACQSYQYYLTTFKEDEEAIAEFCEMEAVKLKFDQLDNDVDLVSSNLSEEEREVKRCFHNLQSRLTPIP